MASVYLESTALSDAITPYGRSNYKRVVRAAENDAVGAHRIVGAPADADIILFIEARCKYHFDVLSSPLMRKYPEKCFIYESQDNPLPLLPGLYMGVPRQLYECGAYRYGAYIRVIDNGVIKENAPFNQPQFLFSFVGKASNAPVRAKVLELADPDALLVDRWSGQSDGDQEYAHLLSNSKFVLCPRGLGASTWRLFEAMRSGRCPVIISDDWQPPFGPKWDECAIIVPEAEIQQIPEKLRKLEYLAEQMGQRAWEEWNLHFSAGRIFNWIIDNIAGIQSNREQWDAAPRRTRLFEALSHRNHRAAFTKEWIREVLHGRAHTMR